MDWREVQGWLTDGQAALLTEHARNIQPGTAIVEVGSHHGKSTIVLAHAKPEACRLLAVDPFDDERWGGGRAALDVFHDNLTRAGVRDQVEHFRGFGSDAAKAWNGDPVGLLYLDGAHDYETVASELGLWTPHLAAGASVLMHDAFSAPGVTRAIVQRLLPARDFRYLGRSRSLAAFRYTRSRPAADAVRALPAFAWFGRNVAVKVAIRSGLARGEYPY